MARGATALTAPESTARDATVLTGPESMTRGAMALTAPESTEQALASECLSPFPDPTARWGVSSAASAASASNPPMAWKAFQEKRRRRCSPVAARPALWVGCSAATAYWGIPTILGARWAVIHSRVFRTIRRCWKYRREGW